MPDTDLIDRTADYVKIKLSGDGSGHDWWHVYRVWKMAKRIGQAEGADFLVVELAALPDSEIVRNLKKKPSQEMKPIDENCILLFLRRL